MTDTEDIDAVAAEYVLGTLPLAKRTAVAARRLREAALGRAIGEWEQRLSPLNEAVAPLAPPAAIRDKILARIAAPRTGGASPAVVVDLKRSVARWRSAALGASALAASLAGFVGYRETLKVEPAKSFVAVLQKDAQSPAFLMTVDIATRSFTVRSVAAQAQAGKSYELWLVHEKLGAPKSLGLLSNVSYSASQKLAAFAPGDIQEATYAVSVEPEGGSPTGLPTGPVVYAGKLVQTTP